MSDLKTCERTYLQRQPNPRSRRRAFLPNRLHFEVIRFLSRLSIDADARLHSSRAYRDKLKEFDTAPKVTERSEAFMPDETQPRDGSSTWGILDYQPDGGDVEEQIRTKPANHFRLRTFRSFFSTTDDLTSAP